MTNLSQDTVRAFRMSVRVRMFVWGFSLLIPIFFIAIAFSMCSHSEYVYLPDVQAIWIFYVLLSGACILGSVWINHLFCSTSVYLNFLISKFTDEKAKCEFDIEESLARFAVKGGMSYFTCIFVGLVPSILGLSFGMIVNNPVYSICFSIVSLGNILLLYPNISMRIHEAIDIYKHFKILCS